MKVLLVRLPRERAALVVSLGGLELILTALLVLCAADLRLGGGRGCRLCRGRRSGMRSRRRSSRVRMGVGRGG